ncbi:MAG TPA: hypothetical protein QGF58_16795 [Myxococcota bacterium]|nr:hypothetical protein [Myxococcota bacterium]
MKTSSGEQLAHADARWWVVYAQDQGAWTIDRILPSSQTTLTMEPGSWAISAAGKHGVESLGVVVQVE